MPIARHDGSSNAASLKTTGILFWLTICHLITLAASVRRNVAPGAPHIATLREETEDLFYHGFDNYMKHAFPEDELRPISCRPLTRDRENPAHIEVNDVLGNYSLTLIDSLSTLAILASSPSNTHRDPPLLQFQNGVKDLVEQYGDGKLGPSGQGKRARGFDLDSKVQVFETVIRGLGGLLSAHLFAVGDLPITGYHPPSEQIAAAKWWQDPTAESKVGGIEWPNGMVYDGQLLRLAYDLGNRIVPAFWTSTGIPYPRVNLRHGTPFYAKSPGNFAPEGQCDVEKKGCTEVTETCSAGAGSLVLEFTVLSRLTDNPKFEELAKRAFWSVWDRRSPIDLIGAGIDAETGVWQHAWTGIGAGIDSFFEYAFKSHVLLSGKPSIRANQIEDPLDPRSLFPPLSTAEHSSEAFLDVWNKAHAAIKRHIYRGPNFHHPHYIQVDLSTGASRAFWVDALSAYYPGLLALSGHVEEAIQAHLMSTAIWARFSALPERYNMASGAIEGGLGWWVGRPELIESTWYLYRATEDPWFIYVGEMILRDIKRRCWTKCGWAGIQNVLTGEKIDRMESFFLGETAKYFFLLFDPDHPLNKLDDPFVFTTEGHPLIIPRGHDKFIEEAVQKNSANEHTCPARPSHHPLTMSNVAARGDVYHAASLARLHLLPKQEVVESVLVEKSPDHPSVTLADIRSPTNYTHYPWTLPLTMIPHNVTSSKMAAAPTFELAFPSMQNQAGNTNPPLQRVQNGILINSLANIRLSMVQDVPTFVDDDYATAYRIQSINTVTLGKDEKVYLSRDTGNVLNPIDPLFSRIRDGTMLDVVVEHGPAVSHAVTALGNASAGSDVQIEIPDLGEMNSSAMKAAWNSLLAQISNLVQDAQGLVLPLGAMETVSGRPEGLYGKTFVPAITPTGPGAAPLPDWPEASALHSPGSERESLPWTNVYAAGEMCKEKLSPRILKTHHVIVVKRGSCSFSKKLSNIPALHPSRSALQLVIVVDFDTVDVAPGEFPTRPLLDEPQTTASGLPRQNLLPMIMVGGGEQTYQALRYARGIGIRRRFSMSTQGIPIANLIIL